jgi:hypothetical protein
MLPCRPKCNFILWVILLVTPPTPAHTASVPHSDSENGECYRLPCGRLWTKTQCLNSLIDLSSALIQECFHTEYEIIKYCGILLHITYREMSLVQMSYVQHCSHNKHTQHNRKDHPSQWDTLMHRRDHMQTHTTGRTTDHYGIH